VAVEPVHAPLRAPGGADEALVLAHREVDPALAAIGGEDDAGAEPARDEVEAPRAPGHLTHPLEADDLQRGVPEPAFRGPEAIGDLTQHIAVVAGGDHRIEGEFAPLGRVDLAGEGRAGQGRADDHQGQEPHQPAPRDNNQNSIYPDHVRVIGEGQGSACASALQDVG
jgi:hypothetical protein